MCPLQSLQCELRLKIPLRDLRASAARLRNTRDATKFDHLCRIITPRRGRGERKNDEEEERQKAKGRERESALKVTNRRGDAAQSERSDAGDVGNRSKLARRGHQMKRNRQ